MKAIPKYGDHMTMESFVEACQAGMFMDYDGRGKYATAKEMSDEDVAPSDVANLNYDKSYTHVVWFNR